MRYSCVNNSNAKVADKSLILTTTSCRLVIDTELDDDGDDDGDDDETGVNEEEAEFTQVI